MHWMTDRRGKDLRLEPVVVVDLDDITNKLHAVGRDVVEPPDKRRDIRSSGLRSEQCLRGRETECNIDLCSFGSKRSAGFEAVERQRHFDDDISGDLGVIPAFGQHPLSIESGDLGRNITLDHLAYLRQMLLKINIAFFRNKRRISRHAVDQAELVRLFYLV